jgi:POT family proton-dependent oligopeptide transporter
MTTATPQLKQPSGLGNLSFFELWERFGFYCVQALLVLYLTKAQHFSDTRAYDLYSAFSALIYATPVIGGYIADKLIGYRHAVVTGTVLYIIGYCALATTHAAFFSPGLALLICGNGFFKGCVSSLLGTLYDDPDARRDSGFTIFYMCFNIGSFLAPIICTWAATSFGWGYGFGAAAIGMLIGFSSASFGFKKLGTHGLPPAPERLTQRIFLGLSRQNLFYIGIVIAVALITWLMNYAKFVNIAFIVFSIITVITIGVFTYRYNNFQRNKMVMLIILMIFSVFFWAVYLQMFSSLVLFTDRIVDRHFLNWTIPASSYISINPFFLLILSPIFATLWLRLRNRRWNPSTSMKFALALLFLGIAFLVIPISIASANSSGMVWQGWMVICYFLLALGELCLSPIGLSMITAFAPKDLTAMLMGVWFLCIAAGFAFGDHIANMTSIPSTITDIHVMGGIYSHVYNYFGWASIAIGVVLAFLTPWLTRIEKTTLPQNHQTTATELQHT